MVSQGALARALSVLSVNASAPPEGDHDAGPLVCSESRLRNRLRCRGGLFLRLGWIALSRVFIFLLHWSAPGRRALDPGALHLRFRPGNVQLLRADQFGVFKHGLSQRAPRSAFNPVAQPAEAARNGAGILQKPEVPHVVAAIAFPVCL